MARMIGYVAAFFTLFDEILIFDDFALLLTDLFVYERHKRLRIHPQIK